MVVNEESPKRGNGPRTKEPSLKSKKIGVLFGGLSREREISLRTGKAIQKALAERGYQVCCIDVGRDIAERLTKARIEVAFIALHGRYGEDGTIQGLLELMGIPYTGSGVLASALCLHKVMAKKILIQENLPTPPFHSLKREEIERGGMKGLLLSLPLVVKPAREGSTIGVSIVRKEEDLQGAVREALKYDDEILIEAFVKGKEITVGILNELPLPIIEIVPKSGFYDFHSKYTKGETEYLIPARIGREKYLYAQEISLKAFQALGCSDVARVDLMTDEEGNPFIIDVNTMPGMTETSLLPKAAEYVGISFGELAERILLGAALKMGR
ncbi:MAG: D-alanine--D-alanine ligase [Desulfobacterota bacterium]|nr:D-alanine--D-alanine ligase [Thermodesulfobacteriota bacterium]